MGAPNRLGELINRTAHSKGAAYWKEGAKSNHYGNYCLEARSENGCE